jgi:hypothetical protein
MKSEDVDAHLEGGGDAPQGPLRNTLQMASLDQRHGGWVSTGPARDVDLAPAASDTDRSNGRSNPGIVHAVSLPAPGLLPLTRALAGWRSRLPSAGREGARSGGQPMLRFDAVQEDDRDDARRLLLVAPEAGHDLGMLLVQAIALGP